jgi:twinkle protein
MPRTWQDVGIEIPPGAVGPEVGTTCPQCSGSRKNKRAHCLSANVETSLWICHHCGWSGSLLTGQTERRETGWRRPEYRRPEPHTETALSPQALAWFEKRGIPAAVLERNGVHSCRVYMPQLEAETSAVAFPYLRGSELVNHKYRDGKKNFRMETGAERILYKLDDVNAETLVWVEGEIDALSVEVAGITSCVSVPDGAPAETAKDYSAKFTFLDSAAELLAGVKRHVIAVDGDGPGRRLEDELARRLGREKCWRVKWPHGVKDANEVLVKNGAEELRWYLENAEPFPIEGVFSTESESDKIVQLFRNGFERGHKTGWASLDPHYTVRPGEFTVVTGVPGSGKSNFVDALLVNLARQHGWSFALFSPENQPLEDHMGRMIEKYIGLPFSDGPTPRMSEDDLGEGMEWARQHFWWILPNDETQWEIGWILARAKELVYRHGIRGLVIDPWNEIEPQRSRDENETEYVSRVLRTVRQWGRQHGVHVWIVVHPTKLYRDKDGKYPIPNLYDCAGSSHWRNKADNGLCIWRDFDPNTGRPLAVDVYVQKIRFRQIGKLGKVTLHYDAPTATYHEVSQYELTERGAV